MSQLLCWNCGENLDDTPRPISRHATCPQCFNELHCCRLCRHYDPHKTATCFEDRADPPLQKENANFCDFFAPRFGAFEAATARKSDTAREGLDALFGSAAEDISDDADAAADTQQDPDKEARRKLDDLFE